MKHRRTSQPPKPTRLGESGVSRPSFRQRGELLELAVALIIRIDPELTIKDEITTAGYLRIPTGTRILASTPLHEQRAQLVFQHFLPTHPAKVMRWIQQVLDQDLQKKVI